MVVPEPLRWLLTLALAGGTMFHLGRVVRPGRPLSRSLSHRIAEALHAVMGGAMVAMLWPFGRAVPASVWLIVFAGSAGWFAGQASRAGRRWVMPAYFMSAAAAMVWMSTAMPAAHGTAMPGAAASAMPAAHGTAMPAAHGTAMPAAHGTAMPAARAMDMPGMEHAVHGTVAWAAVPIGVYLVVAGLCWLLSGLRLGALRAPSAETAPCEAHWPALCHGVMGVSMGLTVLTML